MIKQIVGPISLTMLFLLLMFATKCVPVGHVGIIKHFGKVTHRPLNEGLHIIFPLVTTVHDMNIKLLKFNSSVSASSKDLQVVSTVVSVQFSLKDVTHLFQQIGNETQIMNVLFNPAVEESVKAVTARYTAEELITNRPLVKTGINTAISLYIKDTLKEKGLNMRAIHIANVAITDFNFSEEFNKSIEMKVRAEQQALQAKNEKLKKITDAEAVAEKIKIESVARANAIQREARALKENPLLIEYKRMEKWDGKLPEVTGGAIPMFDIKKHRK